MGDVCMIYFFINFPDFPPLLKGHTIQLFYFFSFLSVYNETVTNSENKIREEQNTIVDPIYNLGLLF